MTTPPDQPSNDDPDAVEAAVDDLAQRAGASLRRPAPEGGALHAMTRGAQIRRRQTIGALAGAGVLAVGVLAIVNQNDNSSETRTISSSPTEPAPGSSVPLVASSAPAVTDAATTTSAPTTTTSLDDRLNQWALDYTGGTPGAASGEPVRIGVADLPLTPVRASAEYLNAELGGIGGRPVELDICEWTDPAGASECGTRFANDPTISLVISGLNQDFMTALGTDKPRFGGVVQNEEGIISYGLPSYGSAYVTLAKVARAQAGPDATKVVLFSFGGDLQFFTPWLDGLEVIPISHFGLDADGVVAALNNANAANADAIMLLGREDACGALRGALEQLGVTPVVVTDLCVSPVPAENWYSVGLAYNLENPSFETGAATAVAKLAQYGVTPDSPLGGFGDDVFNFADVLTAAKIVNSLGGPAAATPDVLRQALLDFKGPAMITGDQDCSLLTNPDPTRYLLPLSCQKTFNLQQVRDGRLVELDPIDFTTP